MCAGAAQCPLCEGPGGLCRALRSLRGLRAFCCWAPQSPAVAVLGCGWGWGAWRGGRAPSAPGEDGLCRCPRAALAAGSGPPSAGGLSPSAAVRGLILRLAAAEHISSDGFAIAEQPGACLFSVF